VRLQVRVICHLDWLKGRVAAAGSLADMGRAAQCYRDGVSIVGREVVHVWMRQRFEACLSRARKSLDAGDVRKMFTQQIHRRSGRGVDEGW
jgi:hypothetical protein